MTVPGHIAKTFKKLGRLSTFVQFQSELFTRLEEDTSDFEGFLQAFNELRTNLERVEFLYEKLRQYDLLDDKFTRDAKDDKKADKHKQRGNKFFSTGKHGLALQCYTRSVQKAQSQEVLAVAYANRSAALYKLNLHEECLTDINRALSNNYPEHLKRSLIDRREKLLALAGAAGDASGHHEPPPPLPDERNPEFEAAAACVELKLTGESKRRVFATRDIHVGEVISVERPFSFTLAAADLYHCHDCFELCYNPISCDSCSQSLYCGEACKASAWDKYHKYECPILISLKNIVGKHKAFLLAVKMSFLIEDESQASDVYKLTENLDKEHIRDELFTTALVTALMFHLVKKYTTKFEGATRQVEEKFKELLMLHLRICLIHAAGIDELCPNVIDGEHRLLNFRSETVGCALFPFYSFLGHACCPNVFAHHHGVTRVLRAIRTIRKGQECLVSYGPYYIEHNKADRQSRLLSQYHLTCKCRACEDDWPQLDLLPYQVTSQEDYAFLGDIRNASVDVAKSSIHRFIDGVRYFEDLEPYMDLTLQQKMLSYCYDVLGNKRQVL